MIAKLLAAFRKPDTTRVLLATLAVGWGLSILTQTVEALQDQADELAELITLRELTLSSLDADLRNIDGINFTFSGAHPEDEPAAADEAPTTPDVPPAVAVELITLRELMRSSLEPDAEVPA